jgi:hypothetical protein
MRPLLLLVLPAVLAAPALTASSAVPTTRGGLGSATISGYEVSSIDYELAGGTIATVSFELAPADASSVRVRLAPDLAWTTCTVAGGAVACPVATDVDAATALEVLAAGLP